jgi:hypothetical protein
VESAVGLPWGWFTLKDPGNITVCSAACMGIAFDHLNKEAAKAASDWKAGVG